MTIEQRIETMIEPTLTDKGFGIVRVQMQGAQRKTLQIMIECLDGSNVTVDDCAVVSRTVSVLMDVEDPIHESYMLEVSSAGLDRPLVKRGDFERFAGSMIKAELYSPYEGHTRLQGLLQGIEGDRVKIELGVEKEVAEIALSDIKKAKLIPEYENAQAKVRKK